MHRLRVFNQRKALDKAKLLVYGDGEVAYIIIRFKIKYHPMKYKETTRDLNARRGLRLAGTMVLVKPRRNKIGLSRAKRGLDVAYYDLISNGDQNQDYRVVLFSL